MRVLVTGGTGFVGSHLVDVLLRRGDRVTALVRSESRGRSLAAAGVELVVGDLHDPAALARAVAGRHVVYHVAGSVAARNAAAYLRTNREGTANLARAAGEAGAPRFLLVSSLAAAGPAVPGTSSPPAQAAPITAYGRSKLAGEQALRDSGLAWTIVRPPAVLGPRDREFLRLFRAARSGRVPVFGRGDQELSWIFGPDLARAIVAAATSEVGVGRIYYACAAGTVTAAELARAVGTAVGREVRLLSIPPGLARPLLTAIGGIAAALGRTTVLNRDKANEFLAPAWTADPAELVHDTGWRAEYGLAEALAETARWYRHEGWL